MQLAFQLFATVHSFPNVFQLLQHNNGMGISIGDDCFGDTMIRIAHKPLFSPANAL
jgi:hypothetical protein